jgi:hypothetical protein
MKSIPDISAIIQDWNWGNWAMGQMNIRTRQRNIRLI